MRLRLEVHVVADQESLARHKMSWEPALAEQLTYQGGGEWHSNGVYLATCAGDLKSLEDLQQFVEERLKEIGVTEFYTEIIEYEV